MVSINSKINENVSGSLPPPPAYVHSPPPYAILESPPLKSIKETQPIIPLQKIEQEQKEYCYDRCTCDQCTCDRCTCDQCMICCCPCYLKTSMDTRCCGLCYCFCPQETIKNIQNGACCPINCQEYCSILETRSGYSQDDDTCCCTFVCCPFKFPILFPWLLGTLFNICMNKICYCIQLERNYLF